MTTQWEYKTETKSGLQADHEKWLNELGGAGWELVTAVQETFLAETITRYSFKRAAADNGPQLLNEQK